MTNISTQPVTSKRSDLSSDCQPFSVGVRLKRCNVGVTLGSSQIVSREYDGDISESPTSEISSLADCRTVTSETFFYSIRDFKRRLIFLNAMYFLGEGFADVRSSIRVARDLRDIELRPVVRESLRRNGIECLEDLCRTSPSDLRRLHGVGDSGLSGLVIELATAGVCLKAPLAATDGSATQELEVSVTDAFRVVPDGGLFGELVERMFERERSFQLSASRPNGMMPLGLINFRKRTKTCLSRKFSGNGVLRDLVSTRPSALLAIHNFGFNSLLDVVSELAEIGTFLGDSRVVDQTEKESEQYLEQFQETSREILVSKVTELLLTGANLSVIAKEVGTTIADIRVIATDLYGSSSLTVIRAENRKRMSSRTDRKDPRRERLEAMMRMRIEGQTYRQIGEEFGVSAEGVRRLAKRNSLLLESLRENAKDLLQQNIFEQIGRGSPLGKIAESTGTDEIEILEQMSSEQFQQMRGELIEFLIINRGLDRDSILHEFGLSIAAARRLVGTAIDRLACSRRVNGSTEKVFTDAEILAALQTAATYAFPLTTKAYRELLYVGEIDGPSVATIHNRFDTWIRACEQAGVESGEPWNRVYERTWSESDLQGFVCQYLVDPDSKGSFSDFARWLAEDEERPSPALIRKRLGGWIVAKNDALVSRYMTTLLEAHP